MKLSHILLEYNRDITAQKWGSKLLAVANKDNSFRELEHLQAYQIDKDERFIPSILAKIESADPTKNKEYTQAIVKMYASGGIKMEDITSTLADYLVKFHKLKTKKMIKPPYNDLMRYNNVQDFYKAVEQFPDVEEKPENRGKAEQLYDDAQIRVIVPVDETAACYYGQGTRWCTAAKNNNMYNSYNKRGPLYIIIPKKPLHTGEKYQFHFESGSFMDEQDRQTDVATLAGRYPQLRKIFKSRALANNTFTLLADKQQLEQAMMNGRKEIINVTSDELDKKIPSILGYVKIETGPEARDVFNAFRDDLDDSRYDLVVAFQTQVYRNLAALNSEDELHELALGAIDIWTERYASWREVIDDEISDEDAVMDLTMTIQGELVDALVPAMKAAATSVIKRELGLTESSLLSTPIGKEKKFSKQVRGTDRAKKIMPGKWGTQHPFNGKLVGGE